MEKEEQKLEQAEMEESEADETTPSVRKSRFGDDGIILAVSAVDSEVSNGVSKSNGHAVELKMAQNGGIITSATEKDEVEERERFLENESEFTNGEHKMKESDGVVENGGQNAEGSDAVGKIESEAINGEVKPGKLVFHDEDEGVKSASTSEQVLQGPGPIKVDVSEINDTYEPPKAGGSVEIEVINEDDLGIAELDVERVIQKQTTHDLYCPNCKSCITKRVILRKRKRRVRIPDEDVKRNKTGAVFSTQPPEDHAHEEGEVGADDAQEPTVHEDGRDTSVFRCLSCFSIFIPTGDGFKLFKKKWFTNIFTSNKHGTAVEQGSGSYTIIPSSDPSPQTIQPSLTDTGSPAGINDTHGCKLDMTAPETVDQPMESKHIQEVRINRDIDLSVATLPVRTQVTNVESTEDGISFPQQDGLKLLITSDKDGNKPNQAVQTGDKEVIQLSPPSASVVQASDVDGNLNILVSIPHEEQDVTATIVTKSVLDHKNVDSRSSDSGDVYPAEVSQQIITETKIEVHPNEPIKTEFSSALLDAPVAKGNETLITIDRQPPALPHVTEGTILQTAAEMATLSETQGSTADRGERRIEVIKSIVYGGLAESITSLSVVSSAVGGGAATLNVLALGAANLIGGLLVISHNLWDLRSDRDEQVSNQITEQKDRYREVLGQRENFMLHAVVAILSYLIFGLVSPVVYGFSFREGDDRQLKLVVAAAASLLCILTLAVAKAYVQRPPKPYLKTVLTFMILGFMVSGVSYAAGRLVERLLEKLGLFEATSPPPNLLVQEMRPVASGWASY